MASGGGGAWKVAYADFVTAMMAFFMVMWLTSQSSDVKKAVAEHFRNPGGRRIAGNDAKSLIQSSHNGNGNRRVIQARGTKKSDGEDRFRKMTDEGERSNVGKIIVFPLNETALTDTGKSDIDHLLPELEGKQQFVEIRGHAASSGGADMQSYLDAWTISYKRSIVVAQYLIDKGIDPRRIRLGQAGSSDPRSGNETGEPLSDSRVELFVLKETFEEPSSQAQRLASTKNLDAEAKVLADNDAKAAAEEPKKEEGKKGGAKKGGH